MIARLLRSGGAEFPGLTRRTHAALRLLALACFLLLLGKAWRDIDLIGWDPLFYHLPFAARIWGITPATSFGFVNYLEEVYRGFPRLTEALQGLLWRVTGRMQAANLVALGSLALYCLFARTYLRLPGAVLFLALIATPLIQIHASTSFVDLPANLACAAALILAYRRCLTRAVPAPWETGLFLLALGATANMKMQLLPMVLLALSVVLVRLVTLYRAGDDVAIRRRIAYTVLAVAVATPLLFATYLKNTILYHNPLYPIPVEILGVELPFGWDAYPKAPEYLQDAPQAVRWLYSILEFRAFDPTRPYLWTGDQGSVPDNSPGDRMGGYGFPFVLLNLALLAYLALRTRSREARIGALGFLLISGITAFLPQSHLLRYYLYWMIALLTLNIALLARLRLPLAITLPAPGHLRLRVPITLGGFAAVCCVCLLVVAALTQGVYFRPTDQRARLDYIAAIDPDIRAALAESTELCVTGGAQLSYLYTENFHAPFHYAVKAVFEADECGTWLVIPAR